MALYVPLICDAKLVLEHDGRRAIRERPVFKVDALGTQARFSSFTDCFENAKCAILERVYFHRNKDLTFSAPFVPSKATVVATLAPFTKAFRRLVKPTTPVPLMQYAIGAYSGRRLATYLRATANVLLRGVSKADAVLATFCKHEKIPESTKRCVPRVIQPRKPEYNVEVGRYIRHLEHPIYHAIDTIFKGPTIMKGLNAFQVGRAFADAWGSFRDPVGVGLDASRFDQHVSYTMLQWEHSMYQLFYPGDRYLQKLLSWQVGNRGIVRCPDGTIKYKTEGGRCSGDMNTSLGNCMIMTSCLYSYICSIGLRVGPGNCVVFNNGDDCMVIVERAMADRFRSGVPAFFNKLGFVMEIEPTVDCFERLSFCQTQPVFDGRYWRMVRDVHTSLSKDATILDRRHATIDLSSQLHAIGECGLSLAGSLPILQSYYLSMMRGTRAGGHVDPRLFESGFYQLSRGCRQCVGPVSTAARVSFFRAFGITPDLQVEIERYYDGLAGSRGHLHDGSETFIHVK